MSIPGSPFDDSAQKLKVVDGYVLQQRLGSGSFATVYKGAKVPLSSSNMSEEEHRIRPDNVAIKAITRHSEKLTKKVLQNLEIEISILRTYRHQNIVCMHNVQKTERHFYLILEYCGGGDVQRLIRTRKAGRLSERLTRRLIRDLAAGLKFLWGQELIHRDIKPQNLLLTGPLPLDEMNDPERSPELEDQRKQADFPSEQFSLKIADFGFARHLQTTSLAETLCGSPLYMAPEILQHHRYDAKADLWSVGTVLFEMIAGRPPFNGENHIDLLRNIQRKAVRLPPDVKVSKACVNLLRLLLNRNPVSRAGFKEFFDACEAFVSLGCEGVAGTDSGSRRISGTPDLGTIHEHDHASNGNSESLMTVATTSQHPSQMQQQKHMAPVRQGMVSPPFTTNPIQMMTLVPTPPTSGNFPTSSRPPSRLTPLEQSPPSSDGLTFPTTRIPALPALSNQSRQQGMSTRSDNAHSQQSSAGDDSGFVMVDRDMAPRPDPYAQVAGSGIAMLPAAQLSDHSHTSTRRLESGSGSQRLLINAPSVLPGRSDYSPMPSSSRGRGMLSTSPGTGGILMGLVSRVPQRLGYNTGGAPPSPPRLDTIIASAAKLLATAEDVGRRAISVAHLGDTRAYLAMRMVYNTEEGSSILSQTPMEDIEEEGSFNGVVSSSRSLRRRSSSYSDKVMKDAKKIAEEDDDEADEMPFAISPEAQPVTLPSRESHSVYGSPSSKPVPKPFQKATPQVIRGHFGEALACYLKALKMLKGAVSGATKASKEVESILPQQVKAPSDLKRLQLRCQVTTKWLEDQFRGVLERADAANTEMAKFPVDKKDTDSEMTNVSMMGVEELIYNHSLASGREGAVKQLLGQYDAARTCYRSAGLLAETLLMERSVSDGDRAVLEEYVDGFAARITELDGLMATQQSGLTNSSSVASSSRRGSGVVGLIGPPPAAPTSFLVSGSPSR